MDITQLNDLLRIMEAVSRRKAIIIALCPDKKLTQKQLADETEISPSNLSRYLKELKKQKILDIRKDNKQGRSVNYVHLLPRTLEILDNALKVQISAQKRPLLDLDNFKKSMERMKIPALQEYAADSIQLASQLYIIPLDSGFFSFLGNHMTDEVIRPKLVVLIKTARNIVGEMSPTEKEHVLNLLGPELHPLTEKGNSDALKRETMNLLKELGAYNKTYEDLKNLYLKQRHTKNNPDLFRSLILTEHRDNLLDLRVSMMDLFDLAPEDEKRWLNTEFALLR